MFQLEGVTELFALFPKLGKTRVFGLIQAARREKRLVHRLVWHCRELIVPSEYLTRSYFDQWILTLAAQMIDAGYITTAELKSGISASTPQPGYPPESAEDARAYVKNTLSYVVETEAAPAFAVGQVVRGKIWGHSGHIRLPGYVRGRPGTISAHHGAHVLPDASARGEHVAQHLYTVGFSASDLWPEARSEDRVFVDLWESYLERV